MTLLYLAFFLLQGPLQQQQQQQLQQQQTMAGGGGTCSSEGESPVSLIDDVKPPADFFSHFYQPEETQACRLFIAVHRYLLDNHVSTEHTLLFRQRPRAISYLQQCKLSFGICVIFCCCLPWSSCTCMYTLSSKTFKDSYLCTRRFASVHVHKQCFPPGWW